MDRDAAKILCKSRDMELKDLPANGHIVHIDDIPVAMGFIRLVEGGYGQFDSFITNSRIPNEFRDKALHLLTSKLIELSKQLKLKSIVSYSLDKNTLLRAYMHGFVHIEHTVIVLDLSKEV